MIIVVVIAVNILIVGLLFRGLFKTIDRIERDTACFAGQCDSYDDYDDDYDYDYGYDY